MEGNIPNNIEVGERIRKIREELKMSRETFSEMIDISDGSWYDKDRNMSAILRKGDGYGIGTGNEIP